VPRDTSEAKDLSVFISIPVSGGTSYPPDTTTRCIPFGLRTQVAVRAQAAAIEQILKKLAELLEEVHRCHLAGHLGEGGADRLGYLQRWYTSLQEEQRSLGEGAQAPEGQ
jgi:hypothetical protein